METGKRDRDERTCTKGQGRKDVDKGTGIDNRDIGVQGQRDRNRGIATY